MDIDEAHEVLDLTPPASDEEVETAFRELTKEYHPDVSDGDTREEWMRIREARELLSKTDRATQKQEEPRDADSDPRGRTDRSSSSDERDDRSTDTDGETDRSTDEDDGSDRSTDTAGEADRERERSYRRDQTDRRQRASQGEGTTATDETDETGTHAGQEISIADLDADFVDQSVTIEGVVADVELEPTDEIDIEIELVDPENPTRRLTVYVWTDTDDRVTLYHWERYRFTGTLLDGQVGDGFELHVESATDIDRVAPGSKRYDLQDEVSGYATQETGVDPGGSDSSGDSYSIDSIDSITGVIGTVLVSLFAVAVVPGALAREFFRTWHQVVIIIVTLFLAATIDIFPTLLGIAWVALAIALSKGGLLFFGFMTVGTFLSDESTEVTLAVFIFFLVTLVYHTVVSWIDPDGN